MSKPEYSIKIRSACKADLDGLERLIHRAATVNAILPRSRAELADYIETFVIAEHEGAVAACASLSAVDPSHAEIRSVAVDPIVQKLGVGYRMLRFLIEVAEQVELSRLFLVTTKPAFFARAGFVSEEIHGSAASYLQAMLHRNGRKLDGKTIMTLDLDMAHFTHHTVESIESLQQTTSQSPLRVDDSPTPEPALILQPTPRQGLLSPPG